MQYEDSLRVCMFVLREAHITCVCASEGQAMTLRSGIAMMSFVNHPYRRYNISILFFKPINGLLFKYLCTLV